MSNWKTSYCIGEEIEKIADTGEIYESPEWSPEDVVEIRNHLEDILRFLGKEDADIVYLSFISKKKQVDICKLLKVTQPAISYDRRKVVQRVNFVIYLLSVIDDFMDFLQNDSHKFKEEHINILILMFFSTSFTKTSQVLKCHQITCRNRFNKILSELKKNGHSNISDIFENILKNLNMIKKTVYRKR